MPLLLRPRAAAAAFFFASLRGGLEELVGISACRRVVTGRGVVFAALQLLLEQELEVFLSLSCGF